jgi:two-component system, OmpR family, sensor kinase
MIDSVRLRLTLWHVAVLAVLLIGFSFSVYALLSSILYGRVDAVLSSVVDGTVSMLDKESSEKKVSLLAPDHALKALSFPAASLAIFDSDGKLLAEKTAGPLQRVPPTAPSDLGLNERHRYTVALEPGGGAVFRAAAVRVNTLPLNKNYIIVAAQSLEPVLRQLETLRRVFYTAVPGVLLLAGFGGWFLARKTLAPVVAMSEHARRIGAENLQERLPVANPRDELGRLAVTLNELLSRLSAAFLRQRQFMADASHELRTPVSVIRTAAAVALDREHREESDYRGLLATIDGQALRLSRIVEDLFRLARADSGHYVLQTRPFYLDELLVEAAHAARLLASPKKISIEMPALDEMPYHGDEGLLRQMISNVIDNSIKYTPPGGKIRLRVEGSTEEFAITISDSGPGIPPEAQPHIFERFFRADEAHSNGDLNGSGGAGLGLSIARWVAEAHDGRLELEHSDGCGTTFVAFLPRSSG